MVSLLKRPVNSSTKSSRPKIIYELTEKLIQRGHSVTVLATGDTDIPGATIIPIIPTSWEDMHGYENPFYLQISTLVILAKKIEELAPQFDIIHNHTYPEVINLLISERINTPMVTTIHTQPFDYLDEALSHFPNAKLLAISKSHRSLLKKSPVFDIVYNGIDTSLFKYEESKDDYLLWLGRLSKAKNDKGEFLDPKGVKWAIKLAKETNSKLLLSGNVEDMAFYKKDVEPHLNDKIKWIGPVSSELSLSKQQVVELMQKARCFLMTVNWQEPFGLVMAESMSCGTPVIGFDNGAIPEIISNGRTGFIVPYKDGLEGLKNALKNIDSINPVDCRKHVEETFSTEAMVSRYEKVYQRVVESK